MNMSKQAPASSGMTPKLREQAAQLCSAYAAACSFGDYSCGTQRLLRALNSTWDADALAMKALDAAIVDPSYPLTDRHAETWALAECLLRTGWVPS